MDCVEDSPGTRVIDEKRNNDHVSITIRLAPESSLSDDLVRMINNKHIKINEVYTEKEVAYFVLNIK